MEFAALSGASTPLGCSHLVQHFILVSEGLNEQFKIGKKVTHRTIFLKKEFVHTTFDGKVWWSGSFVIDSLILYLFIQQIFLNYLLYACNCCQDWEYNFEPQLTLYCLHFFSFLFLN